MVLHKKSNIYTSIVFTRYFLDTSIKQSTKIIGNPFLHTFCGKFSYAAKLELVTMQLSGNWVLE